MLSVYRGMTKQADATVGDTGTRHAHGREHGVRCPIPGCNFVYEVGIRGWAFHVGRSANHPAWQAELAAPTNRQNAFRKEFPEWFTRSSTYARWQSGTTPRPEAPTRVVERASNIDAAVDAVVRALKAGDALVIERILAALVRAQK